MPIYTYRCESCGVQFERHQSFSDEPLRRCPECSKNSLRKVLTPAGIIFKGSGWYATDHKSPSGQNRPLKAEGKEAGDSKSASEGASGEGKSESSGSESKKESSSSASKAESSGGSTATKAESSSKASE
jgi:putative FmdB family regulatory protein